MKAVACGSTYHVDEIALDNSIKKTMLAELPEAFDVKEMSNQDVAFLCGLLRQRRPRKIVEVGVSTGATSAIVMRCMQELGCPYEMWSVEILEHVHHMPGKKSGYLAEQAQAQFGVKDYHLLRGCVLPQVIERIGDGIDFLILDTTHRLPGEVLDFLVAYPYLADSATVCLHDVCLNLTDIRHAGSVATNALFNAVVAEKYIDTDEKRTAGYPNIAAFVTGEETGKYIANIAGVLTQCWERMPDEEHLASYSRAIEAAYGPEVVWVYCHALELNRAYIAKYEEYDYSFARRAGRKVEKLLGSSMYRD